MRVEPAHCPTGATTGGAGCERSLLWGIPPSLFVRAPCSLHDWGVKADLTWLVCSRSPTSHIHTISARSYNRVTAAPCEGGEFVWPKATAQGARFGCNEQEPLACMIIWRAQKLQQSKIASKGSSSLRGTARAEPGIRAFIGKEARVVRVGGVQEHASHPRVFSLF
jgi:hypothetical protein